MNRTFACGFVNDAKNIWQQLVCKGEVVGVNGVVDFFDFGLHCRQQHTVLQVLFLDDQNSFFGTLDVWHGGLLLSVK